MELWHAVARSDIARRPQTDGSCRATYHAQSAPPRRPDMSGILRRGSDPEGSKRTRYCQCQSAERSEPAAEPVCTVRARTGECSPACAARSTDGAQLGRCSARQPQPIVGEAWGVADRKGRVCAGNVTGRIRAPSHARWGKAKTQREARKADPWHGRRAARPEHGCAGLWLAWLGGRRRRSGHRLIQSRRRGASCEVS